MEPDVIFEQNDFIVTFWNEIYNWEGVSYFVSILKPQCANNNSEIII